MTIEEKANSWLNSPAVDDKTKSKIRALKEANGSEFEDSFYRDLEFGTGGLRGVMGVGSNRMNKYTIGMATQGLSNYLRKTFTEEDISVAVAYDSRNNSRHFAEVTAGVFSANGINVYLFENLRPTPELSFAIRQLGCKSGVVVTASHNPKEYNGYKAYWEDGAQLVAPHDKNVIKEVQAIESFENVLFTANKDLIAPLAEDMDREYHEMIAGLCLSPDAIKKHNDLKIVFSPIHGTGIEGVPQVLKRIGFTNVNTVEEQSKPNGDFPTVVYPNPEEAEAMSLALKEAEKVDADLVMATDPDSDRVGIAVKNSKGEFQLLNGNQTGSLLIFYLLSKWKENNKLHGSEYVVKTIVTTELIKVIADDFNVQMYDTLTGFKFIAALIKELEGKEQFIGGGEESYGYLIGDKVRDKDAIASCALIAEMTAWAKSHGKSLFDLLLDINQKYGLFQEGLKSITKKGQSGADQIQEMMRKFRSTPPQALDGSRVTEMIDYQQGIAKDLESGNETTINFPKSNVLQFFTEDGSKVSVRPSGTEPKIKFYCSVQTKLSSADEYFTKVDLLNAKIERLIEALES